ncbi:hypothetical protein CPter291_1888 [Collimonas pratensis]|uniref:Uncharacterized protein n=1 Tax=Collimonas pratensis TaxID=279113 RepID=A0A127QVH1_9BURK|nr:hypothetical protein CPter91_1861 [Collimonas pratensis]AMP14154.1 hypothetical protein CPter291_1888 [Collimonas pratensis]
MSFFTLVSDKNNEVSEIREHPWVMHFVFLFDIAVVASIF